MSVAEQKREARKAAFERRKLADAAVTSQANEHLLSAVRSVPGTIVSGYWPIRTEIDPRTALSELTDTHDICLPVVGADASPLAFRQWTPNTPMVVGAFGAAIPEPLVEMTPTILIVPLAAFTDEGHRLGYGGGYYDRSLEQLRASAHTFAVGFAYEIQRADGLPQEPTDQPLDAIVTETGIRRFPR